MPRYRAERTKPWLATIRKGKSEVSVGWFRTYDEAICAEYDNGRSIRQAGRMCTCEVCKVKSG